MRGLDAVEGGHTRATGENRRNRPHYGQIGAGVTVPTWPLEPAMPDFLFDFLSVH